MTAALVLVEAGLIGVQVVVEVISLSGQRLLMGGTTALFFLLYGLALAWCAAALTRRKSWARAPIVVAQLIQLLVAWDFLGGGTTPVALVLLAVAVAVLGGLFHPRSTAALAGPDGNHSAADR